MAGRMKAVVYTRYGPPEVLQLTDIEKPVPRDNEVLIRVHATTVTSGDCRVRSMNVPRGFKLLARLALGVTRPRHTVLGLELAGTIEAAGKNVRNFAAGDRVFGMPGMGCYAEYKCVADDGPIALIPANLTYDDAASLCFGGTTALNFFRRGKLQRGESVLVIGASGSVGTAAVQLAQHFGAEVTGVCSTANADLVRSLGAARVIDYTKEDFTTNGERYDVIVDTAGTAPFSRSKGSLNDGGRLLVVLGSFGETLRAPWNSITTRKKVVAGPASATRDDVRLLASLAESGAYKPVIDRRYRLEEMVDAHRYVDLGHKKGNVVVTLD